MDWQQTASVGSAVWTSVALLTAAVAGMQGRGKLWWFFITMIFGPIALFFLAIWTEPLEKRDSA
ncbi:hypothetical protein FM104_14825 [Microbacterium esteraromaticum]|uniref:Antitermination protein NusB n=1 Tax=Microbacterium esteraromaticum TaxID=57043 RepID=A0A1R4KQP6_9MICO|nr:hypothetical protein [Microbacterium esteraromaticum]SJN46334.1 hypothetical protein FM104_14825 [Microbacterium esteraromaticum]